MTTCPSIIDGDSGSLDASLTLRNRTDHCRTPPEYHLSVDHLPALVASSSVGLDKSANAGVVNNAFSTDSLADGLNRIDAVPVPSDSLCDQQAPHRTLRNVLSVIGDLLKNTRYVLIIVAHLVEGILLKGNFRISTRPYRCLCLRNLQGLCRS